jgi:hypothetical protein
LFPPIDDPTKSKEFLTAKNEDFFLRAKIISGKPLERDPDGEVRGWMETIRRMIAGEPF